MTTAGLGRLTKVDLRTIWVNEATSFTPWLAQEDNLKLLGEALGIDLSLEAQERNVGPFRADLLCKDAATDHWVLIENQIERTDHGHLGQLLTYAAGLSAVTVVWIAQRFTEEHRAALDWLNEVTNEEISFFGLEIELWRIGDSVAAPKFNVVSKPNEFVKRQVAERAQTSTSNAFYLEYWEAFSQYVEGHSRIIRMGTPKGHYRTWMSIGKSGYLLRCAASVRDKITIVDFVAIRDGDKAAFRTLELSREEIDARLRGVQWNEKAGMKESALEFRLALDPAERNDWEGQFRMMLEKLEELHKVLVPKLKELP